MSENSTRPVVPSGPTSPNTNAPTPGRPEGDGKKSEEGRTGGRRSWNEIAEENGVLAGRVEELVKALTPLAKIPMDRNLPADGVQYALAKEGRPFLVTTAMLRAAREAVGSE